MSYKNIHPPQSYHELSTETRTFYLFFARLVSLLQPRVAAGGTAVRFHWLLTCLLSVTSIIKSFIVLLTRLLVFVTRCQWFTVVSRLMPALPFLCGIRLRQAADRPESNR